MIHLITTVETRRISWLPQFVEHYRSAGVERFHITIHVSPTEHEGRKQEALSTAGSYLRELHAGAPRLLICAFDAMALRQHHNCVQQVECAPSDWIVWADIDEFHGFNRSLGELVNRWDADGANVAGGTLLDQVAPDGSLPAFIPHVPIWQQYPCSARITERLAQGDVRKVVCSRADVQISFGNHSPEPGQSLRWASEKFIVHHFKWDSTLSERLLPRLDPDWRERCWWWRESERILHHLEAHGGRLNLDRLEEDVVQKLGKTA